MGVSLVGLVLACEAPFSAGEVTGEGGDGQAGTSDVRAGSGGSARDGGSGGDETSEPAGGRAGGGSGGGASAGVPGGGTAAGGSGGTPTLKLDCGELGAPGEFQDITPPEVKAGIGQPAEIGHPGGGPAAFEIDPVNLGTYYLGTEYQGLWKTIDCGGSWSKVATGKTGTDINRGHVWTLAIDPQEPQTLYTSSAYGANGLFKSKDGGKTWVDVWSATTQPVFGMMFDNNLVHQIAVDPAQGRHLLLTMHEPCHLPEAGNCIMESQDGGATWELHRGLSEWEPESGQSLQFLSSQEWLVGSQGNGVWRTLDAGKTWIEVPGMSTTGARGVVVVRLPRGGYLLGGADGVWRSPDGAADSWVLEPSIGPFVGGLVSDGTTAYVSTCVVPDYCMDGARYLTTKDGKTFAPLAGAPKLPEGGVLRFDGGHRLLLSDNGKTGLWRAYLPPAE